MKALCERRAVLFIPHPSALIPAFACARILRALRMLVSSSQEQTVADAGASRGISESPTV